MAVDEPAALSAPTVRAVAKRILEQAPALVERLGQLYRAEVPEYAALSPGTLEREVLPVTATFIDHFFSALASAQPPVIERVPGLEEMGARRLALGVPLEAMLHVFRLAGRGVFEAVADVIEPGEESALAPIGAAWMDFIDHGSSRGTVGYLDASNEQVRRVEARRGALLDVLLAASTEQEITAVETESAVRLASLYAAVVAAAADSVSVRDVVSRLPAGSLVGWRGPFLLLLVPDAVPDLGRLAGPLAAGPLVWAEPVAPGSDLRAEVGNLERSLHLALAHGLTGTFGPDDLVLERLTGADRRVSERLAGKVAGSLIERDPGRVLFETLQAYLATGSVSDTAELVFAHPNTVAARLRRVKDRTGLDPRVPADSAVLMLALKAYQGMSTDHRRKT